MHNWIETFKKLVITSHKPHIIVADQDHLFSYAEMSQVFKNEGYTVKKCKSAISVRLTFELEVRGSSSKWLLVAPPDYQPLPDLEVHVHFQSIGLSQLFPMLDAKAIKGLSFNALSLLSNIRLYETLGHDRTLKFLLENLYHVDFDALSSNRQKERILNALIQIYLEKEGINEPLTVFLTNLTKPHFPMLVQNGLDANKLVRFLQEKWQEYVHTGSSMLRFEDTLLNKSIGYLFMFGDLTPVKICKEDYEFFPKHLRIGVYYDDEGQNDLELEGHIAYFEQQIDGLEDIADQWFKIIQQLAMAKLKYLKTANQELKLAYEEVEREINGRFQRFLDNAFGSLFSLSGVRRPVVVSRILDHLHAKPAPKKALIVIDGMNYWQWIMLGKALTAQGLDYSASATLAYIPTITAWSRQAIFRGERPDLQQDNSKEGKLFESYWVKQGIPTYQILYRKFGVSEPLMTDTIGSDIKILGLVCNDLDDIMHGSVMGDAQLSLTTEQWIVKSAISQIVTNLKAIGFEVTITADHGNVEAKGIKGLRVEDKVGTVSRGKRHLQFTNETMLAGFLEKNSGLVFGRKGLSIYLKHKEAFSIEGNKIITHGGSHFWEVIVPYICIDDK